jgi:NAD(P)-dependent dehydrogenase (short-subunit alcohol dehydrogenase family)
MFMISLENQTAVIGGGAGEIGAAVSAGLARLGAKVWIADKNGARAAALGDSLSAAGLDVRASEVDFTSVSEVRGLVDSATQEWGRLDIAVNTVGWTAATPFVEENDEYWRHIVDLNLMSSVYLAHSALPHMQRAHYGRIVLVSSLAGRIGRRGRALYSASKAGVIGFAKAVALEVAPDGITVNCLAPGATDTEMMRAQGEDHTRFALDNIPRGQFASPDDQAYGVAVLVSRQAAHITGQTLAVDGGATMI